MFMKLVLIPTALLLVGCQAPPPPFSVDRYLDQLKTRDAPANNATKASFASRATKRGVALALQKQTKAYLGDKLLDGETARYRFDFTSAQADSVAVCGAVNGKNLAGGYVGFKPFFVEFANGKPTAYAIQPFTDPDTRRRINEVCGGISGDDSSRFATDIR